MVDAVLIRGESNSAYHQNPCGSSSKLRDFREKGAWYYHGRHVTHTIAPDEPTNALILGIGFDLLVTEGLNAFNDQYVVKPEGMSFATKEGKEWKARHVQGGQSLITYDEWTAFEQMHASIKSHELYDELIHKDVIAQASVRCPMTKYGIGLQSRPDFLSLRPCAHSDGKPYNINLKTTADFNDWIDCGDLESNRAGSPVFTYGYMSQCATDSWVLYQCPEIGETVSLHLVVEKQAPFRCGVFRLSEEYIDAGWQIQEATLMQIKKCVESNHWPKAPGGIIKLNAPAWLTKMADRRSMAAL